MKTEPKIGERVAWNNVRYRCYEDKIDSCCSCDFDETEICRLVECCGSCRQDGKGVIFIREGHYSRRELIEILKRRRKS